ncbi:MAG TPA: hypothetical protein VGF09_00590 [Solirubrobacterales bacterium]|jgi:hypothetical protein
MAERKNMSRFFATLAAAIVAMALTWGFADRALAVEEISEFATHVSTTQAGGHPDVDYSVTWSARNSSNRPCNCEDARVLDMHFPTGFIGDPHNVPACRLTEFALHACPPESQVGVVEIQGAVREAMFNLVPHADEAGLTGFYVLGANTALFVILHARTGSDYGLDATTSPIYQFFPITTTAVHLWGVPADPSHDANRFPVGTTEGIECKPYPGGCFGPVQSSSPPAPYLQNPTTCGVPLTASHSIEYYSGVVVEADNAWPATTGCDQLTFSPSLTATPTTEAADSMSGLDVTLTVPQTQSPTTPSPSEIRSAEMTLPEGFSLAPNAANGKVACADDELSFTTEEAAHCPEFAKIGTSTIDSSALPGPIQGSVYIGQPLPGQTYRIFVTADGFATHVKLKGAVELDPQTGRVVTTFSDLPQSPIQEVALHFFGSERGIFATPKRCGSYPVVTRFTPWDQVLEDQVSTSSISVITGPDGTPCPPSPSPFHPAVNAGSADNTAGAFAPFTVEASRDDGDQEPTALKVSTPPGFLASLRGVAYCPEPAISGLLSGAHSGRQEQAAPLCPAASRIGFIKAGTGPGTRPLYVGGDVYLAGPYRGAPLSLLVVIPAVSGPYDLGNVVTRVAVFIDPATAQITTVSDPLPRILDGVPLRTRYLQVGLDRPDFTLNPTRCDPFSIGTQLFGDEGALTDFQTHFQVANCSAMGYSPALSLSLTGGLEARGHPAIHALFKARPGDANTQRVSVTLPNGEQLDNAHIGTICRRAEFAADQCPASSLVGHARVVTPLLDEPLEGSVYLRASSHKLPDLVMDLEGQIEIELAGRVDAVNGRLRTTFESVPDAPVSSLKFDLLGGAKGLVVNSGGLCGRTKRATVKMTGQNGDVLNVKPKLRTSCGSGASRKRHGSGRGRG